MGQREGLYEKSASEGQARQKQAKKRSLRAVNEHFEPVFNAAPPSAGTFRTEPSPFPATSTYNNRPSLNNLARLLIMRPHPPRHSEEHRSAFAAALIGAGLMAAVDEIVFHQILAWHHFYDKATPLVGLISDGILHAGELVALVAGFFLISNLRARSELKPQFAFAGFFLGLGGFQLFDGVIDHKLLRLHQIRYDVDNILTYDIAWNVFALILLMIGTVLWRRARQGSGMNRDSSTR